MKAIKKSLNKNRKSYAYALKGVELASKGNNFRYQLISAIMIIILGLVTSLKTWEWIAIVIMIGSVLAAEVFNTAIELLVDLISPEYNLQAGKVKDLAAGGVILLATTSVIVALLIFIPKIIHY